MRDKINKAVLHWVLYRMLSTDGWANKQLTLVMTAVFKTLAKAYPEDNHATTSDFMQEVLKDVINNQKPL